MNGRRGIAKPVACTALVLCTHTAHAHLVSTELGPFYDGVIHPFVTPHEVMTISAFAILAAFTGIETARRQFFALTVGWTAGLLAGFGGATLSVPFVSEIAVLILGILGLSKVRLPPPLLITAATLIGAGNGLGNATEVQEVSQTPIRSVGVVVGVFTMSCVLSALAVFADEHKASVVLRVISSWIAAIALLSLGWQLR